LFKNQPVIDEEYVFIAWFFGIFKIVENRLLYLKTTLDWQGLIQ
jgi:hypothetical protein